MMTVWDDCTSLVTSNGTWKTIEAESVGGQQTPIPMQVTPNAMGAYSSVGVVVPVGIFNAYMFKNDGGAVMPIFDFSVNSVLKFWVRQTGNVVPINFSITTRYPDANHWDGHGYGDIGSGLQVGVWKQFTIDLRQSGVNVVSPYDLSATAQLTFEIVANAGGADVEVAFFEVEQGAPLPLQALITPQTAKLWKNTSQTFSVSPAGGATPYSQLWKVDGVDVGTATLYVYTASQEGVHTITCTITDAVGAKVTVTATATTVLQPPIPTMLHTSGNKILNASGQEVRLLGVNYAGLCDFTDGMFPVEGGGMFSGAGHWSEAGVRSQLSAMAAWGCNCVRLHLNMDWWIRDYTGTTWEGYTSDINYREAIKQVIQIAKDYGLYVIVDAYMIQAGVDAGIPWQAGTAVPDQQAFVNWWVSMSQELHVYENVVYELFNETQGDMNTNLQAFKTTIDAVRAVGDNHVIIVQVNYCWDMWWVDENVFGKSLGEVYGANLVISEHIYYDRGGTYVWNPTGEVNGHTYTPVTDLTNKSQLQLRLQELGYYHVLNDLKLPIIVGEIGCPEGLTDTDLTAYTLLLQLFNESKFSFAAWVWRAGVAYTLFAAGVAPFPPNEAGQIFMEAIESTTPPPSIPWLPILLATLGIGAVYWGTKK